ncbi:MAG: hypothetical protein HXY34_05945 [Candidatus Thorarchaeota archaeon]|nr:hypothetical protein [Candidatus Thorarchaeota archaeon]
MRSESQQDEHQHLHSVDTEAASGCITSRAESLRILREETQSPRLMMVQSIDFAKEYYRDNRLLRVAVRVVDAQGRSVERGQIRLSVLSPSGERTHMTSSTGKDGVALFSICHAASGRWAVNVLDVTHPSFEFPDLVHPERCGSTSV